MHARSSTQSGFTLIDLLLVVVVIAILAAIAIPRLGSTKDKELDAAAKTDLRNAMTAQEAYWDQHQTYADDAAELDFDRTTYVTTTVVYGNEREYEMCAQHGESENGWTVNSNDGQILLLTEAGC